MEAAFPRALLGRIFVATVGSVVLNLSATSVSVATRALMNEFDAPLDTMQWNVTGYLLAMTLVLPAFRWAVERVGSRRLYVGALVAFGVASALCALSWSAGSLIVFRLLQGAVGGLLAPILGPVLGGALLEFASWHWLFLVNAPVALIGAWLAWRLLPPGETATRSRLDVIGLSLLAPGIALFTWALATPRSLALLFSLALIAAFVIHARRRPTSALVDLRTFSRRSLRAFLATYLLVSFGSFGAQFVLPLYFQEVRGEPAFNAGMLLAPQGIGMLITLPRVGRLTDRFDHGKIVIAGVLVSLAGSLPLIFIGPNTPYALLVSALSVRGAGLGATNTPALAAAYRDLPPEEIPNATTVINVTQRLGAQLGTVLMATALQHFLARAHEPVRAFANTFALGAALSLPALFTGCALIRPQTPSSASS